MKKIVIVGGGAGGLELATRLGKKLGRSKKAKIVLVDSNHSHLWKPLLHEVAAGSLDGGVDALSYLAHARNHYFQFQLGSLININRSNKTISLSEIRDSTGKPLAPERKLAYDVLVIALGSISNDFNIPGIKEHCIFLDNSRQAHFFHQKMLNLFLRCSNNANLNKKVNITIVGGGATGVELSAEIYNAVVHLQNYGYKWLKSNVLEVTLIEAEERILPTLPLRVSKTVHSKLLKLGTRILIQTIITSSDAGGLYTKSGEYIQSDLMVWAAGIKVPDFMKEIGGLETNCINQLIVKPTLQVTRDPEIFAIGDCASCACPGGGFVPPRAQAAHQMASLVLYNIEAKINGKSTKDYIYKDHGYLVSLSTFSTIGSLRLPGTLIRNSIVIEGRIARLIYILLYRMHQITLHGYFKTFLIILVSQINRIIRPRIKMY